MSSRDTYHVLFCCDSRKDADQFADLLRQSAPGITVRARVITSMEELEDCLGDGSWELVLTTEGKDQLAAPLVIAAARTAATPVVFCGTVLQSGQAEELLQAGASEVLTRAQLGRLFHVVSREIVALRCRRALDNLRPRYEEIMRRSELLLDAVEEPVAYAADGVHLHCNKAYARIFGFDQAEDLQGVPQLDLIIPEDQERFKEALRRHRSQPDETFSMPIALVRGDGSPFSAELIFSRTSYEGERCMQVLVRTDLAQQGPGAPSAGAVAALRSVPGLARPRAASPTEGRREVVRVEEAWKEYAMGNQVVTALRDVSVRIGDGEFMALAGPSGSGKSTLLNLIGCIDVATRGSVSIDGTEVSNRTPDELSDLRARTIGFIFQTFNLLPVLSAWENVEYPLLQNKTVDKSERRERVGHYLDLVGLDRHKHRRPNELSGGQRQRVAIARALAARPAIILADEPTANLDHKTGEGILDLMKSINQKEGTTFIFSTHDSKVMAMADRVVVLSDGEVVGERFKI